MIAKIPKLTIYQTLKNALDMIIWLFVMVIAFVFAYIWSSGMFVFGMVLYPYYDPTIVYFGLCGLMLVFTGLYLYLNRTNKYRERGDNDGYMVVKFVDEIGPEAADLLVAYAYISLIVLLLTSLGIATGLQFSGHGVEVLKEYKDFIAYILSIDTTLFYGGYLFLRVFTYRI